MLGDDVNDYEEETNYQAVLMALLEKEMTTMDGAQGIALKDVLIEEASCSTDFRNNYSYDRRIEELTAALESGRIQYATVGIPDHTQTSSAVETSGMKLMVRYRDSPVNFLLDSEAAISTISKEVWDKLDISDQDGKGLTY
ncbi:3-diacetamido-2,3-dideoxy-D-glucuronate 2-epimerase,UDP-2 [Trichinella spiralis]|uniref:3-diacetamido-2,3-dideoxy-D-glucuronate 2-epimerase,UDP-2 n=1 Tax=Trichinella spiralis TaxID=6334 RepID=A0ABR3K3R9_TRISP